MSISRRNYLNKYLLKHKNTPRKKLRNYPPCLSNKLRHYNRVTDWWAPQNTFKISNSALLLKLSNSTAFKISKISSSALPLK